jgi:hypothetical protein
MNSVTASVLELRLALIGQEQRSPERIMEASKMVSAQSRLKALIKMSGFALVAVVLSALVRTATASAQCGPAPGSNNTACGAGTLTSNTTGDNDSAFGVNALFSNTTGINNTASGAGALQSNTTGVANTASGFLALLNNTTGGDNTASGEGALNHNTTGNFNTASGFFALLNNTTGSGNIGLGFNAGENIRTGMNNIDIGNAGINESNTIRIGAPSTQTRTFIAGIFGKTVNANGVPVIVDNTGKLGVMISSARYKRDIRDMDAASAGLMKLRPVTFLYKNDPSGTLQYGLVAEEVAQVYPELVSRETDGSP